MIGSSFGFSCRQRAKIETFFNLCSVYNSFNLISNMKSRWKTTFKWNHDDNVINDVTVRLNTALFIYVWERMVLGTNSNGSILGINANVVIILLDYEWLTLNVRGPSYIGLTRSISWLLMPWLLPSPGYQQSWYWLYRICTSFSYSRKDFKYQCQINVEEWHKMQIYVHIPSEKYST